MTTLTFIIYIVLLFYIGFLAYQRIHSISDYILGGRSLGHWITAISAGASDMSGWLLLGVPGFVYVNGMQAVWLIGGLWLGSYMNWRLVAMRLRVYSELAADSLTLPAFLNQRVADNKNHIRLVAASCTIFFFLLYTVSGLVASGKLFNSVFGVPYEWAIIIGMLAIVLYTLFGGFLAVSWTDLFQGLLMLFALMLIPLLALGEFDSWQQARTVIDTGAPYFFSLWHDKQGEPLGVIGIVSLMSWGLGYFGLPHVLARFKAIRDPRQLPQARRIAMSWVGLSMLGAMAVGLMGFALLSPKMVLEDEERVFIILINQLLSPVLAGICLAAILAAIMSTADSQLLVSASVLIEDIYRPFSRRTLSQAHLLWVARIVVIIIAVIATLLASDPDSSVLSLVGYAWAGFGAAFGPAVLFSLFWQQTNKPGILAGMLSGAVTVVIWEQLEGGFFDVYEILPGFVFSCLMIILVTKITGGASSSTKQQFAVMQKQVTDFH